MGYIFDCEKKLYVKEMSRYWKIKCPAKVINSNLEQLIGSFCKFNYTTYTNYMLQMMNSLNFLYNLCIDSHNVSYARLMKGKKSIIEEKIAKNVIILEVSLICLYIYIFNYF
jgi:hypothetical protein